MSTANIQVNVFQHIKGLLPAHVSLVDTVAELLHISNDSAYRRIRGEKQMSIEELQKLASHYRISLDQLLHIETDAFVFTGKLANSTDHLFEKWMENIVHLMQHMSSFQHRHMFYLAKDVPVMQQFLVPELTYFKSFFWRKSILHYDHLRGQKFSLNDIDPSHLALGEKIVKFYNLVPSTDIWNVESINSTIRQIEFYRDAQAFNSNEDIDRLYRAVLKLIDHIEKQAELGLKFSVDCEPADNAAPYNLFNNELILADNTVMAELDNMRTTFLNHSVINYVSTRDVRFNAHMMDAIQNLIRKSTQLSRVGERERIRFFNRIRDKVRQAARF